VLHAPSLRTLVLRDFVSQRVDEPDLDPVYRLFAPKEGTTAVPVWLAAVACGIIPGGPTPGGQSSSSEDGATVPAGNESDEAVLCGAEPASGADDDATAMATPAASDPLEQAALPGPTTATAATAATTDADAPASVPSPSAAIQHELSLLAPCSSPELRAALAVTSLEDFDALFADIDPVIDIGVLRADLPLNLSQTSYLGVTASLETLPPSAARLSARTARVLKAAGFQAPMGDANHDPDVLDMVFTYALCGVVAKRGPEDAGKLPARFPECVSDKEWPECGVGRECTVFWLYPKLPKTK
jgi:hypothetical protein